MTLAAVAGFFATLLATQLVPQSYRHPLAGIVALAFIITGVDLLSVAALPHHDSATKSFAGGVLTGVGIGYFVIELRKLLRPAIEPAVRLILRL